VRVSAECPHPTLHCPDKGYQGRFTRHFTRDPCAMVIRVLGSAVLVYLGVCKLYISLCCRFVELYVLQKELSVMNGITNTFMFI
jgi:hypothetical protein